jgi:hypothetical protein
MRDALRAVVLVIGVFAVFVGSLGLFRGRLNRTEMIAVGVGLALLVIVSLIPPGKPGRPLYEDWDEGQQNW